MMLCALVCMAFILAGCNRASSSVSSSSASDSSSASSSQSSSDGSSSNKGAVEGLKKQGVLTVGVRPSLSAPYITNAEGSLEGLDVDLGATLADDLGLSVEFVAVEDVPKALSENCDVVMGVSQSEASGFDVVNPYTQTALALFHHGEPAVLNMPDIIGKNVGLQDESPAQVALRLTPLEVVESPVSSVNEAFDALDRGAVDLVLCNASTGAYLSSWRDGISFAGALEEPVSVGMAVASGGGSVQDAVKKSFEHIQQNGLLDEVRRTWLGNLPTLSKDSVISGVAPKEEHSDLPAKPAAVQLEEVALDAKDGSTAGANAVTMEEAQSLAQSSGTSSTSGSGGSGQSQATSGGAYGGTAGGAYAGNSGGSASTSGGGTGGSGYTDYGGEGYYAESYGY